LGRIREAELRAAASKLGLCRLEFLDYVDGELDKAPHAEIIGQIVAHLRVIRPQVVVTFGPDGGYGHPDHIAISQFTAAALVCAADPAYTAHSSISLLAEPHRVSKFYYRVWTQNDIALEVELFGELTFMVDNVLRHGVAWPDWAVTTSIDTTIYAQVTQEAIFCHQSQLLNYASHFQQLTKEQLRQLWGRHTLYRVYSLVSSGREVETDLFAGLRAGGGNSQQPITNNQ
jgi:LmbE family N-acetylglucosaminyl deacetylase